jgi:Methyltransferase domain
MQKDKTLQFWDDFYRSEQKKVERDNVTESIKEWIVQPSDELFRLILRDLFSSNRGSGDGDGDEPPNHNAYGTNSADNIVTIYKILEIGCGTSLLSDSLCKYWDHHVADGAKKLHVIATDVSPVCIEQQIKLQEQRQLLQQEKRQNICLDNEFPPKTKLEYQVLNITESRPELVSQFDMILDKGCLDTCLFRSKNTEDWIDTVLHNIYSWLKVPNGLYTIITPRSKIKHVRDYIGFHVTRTILNESQFGTGDLEPRSSSTTNQHQSNATVEDVKEARQYMYTCRRRQISDTPNNINVTVDTLTQPLLCTTCGVNYDSFCSVKGSKVCSSDTKYWSRRWLGHLQHCRSSTAATTTAN